MTEKNKTAIRTGNLVAWMVFFFFQKKKQKALFRYADLVLGRKP
jgi:hypothetical protein